MSTTREYDLAVRKHMLADGCRADYYLLPQLGDKALPETAVAPKTVTVLPKVLQTTTKPLPKSRAEIQKEYRARKGK